MESAEHLFFFMAKDTKRKDFNFCWLQPLDSMIGLKRHAYFHFAEYKYWIQKVFSIYIHLKILERTFNTWADEPSKSLTKTISEDPKNPKFSLDFYNQTVSISKNRIFHFSTETITFKWLLNSCRYIPWDLNCIGRNTSHRWEQRVKVKVSLSPYTRASPERRWRTRVHKFRTHKIEKRRAAPPAHDPRREEQQFANKICTRRHRHRWCAPPSRRKSNYTKRRERVFRPPSQAQNANTYPQIVG
jgi:hypothetical protein